LRLGSVAWGVRCNDFVVSWCGVRVGSIPHGGDELAPPIYIGCWLYAALMDYWHLLWYLRLSDIWIKERIYYFIYLYLVEPQLICDVCSKFMLVSSFTCLYNWFSCWVCQQFYEIVILFRNLLSDTVGSYVEGSWKSWYSHFQNRWSVKADERQRTSKAEEL